MPIQLAVAARRPLEKHHFLRCGWRRETEPPRLVCCDDLDHVLALVSLVHRLHLGSRGILDAVQHPWFALGWESRAPAPHGLSLIHISEPTRLLSISYAVFCLKKKKKKNKNILSYMCISVNNMKINNI
eukprot:TRINITY_DN862_c0_g2_i8.p1 TRINITY_DN862_c0_g2~~TRINITY_DN862_c0_g2_i8.p1  ORF type:complete len:129 (-),score=21.09 TRINITY_DN862_c0_g2_i8:39-425(-)